MTEFLNVSSQILYSIQQILNKSGSIYVMTEEIEVHLGTILVGFQVVILLLKKKKKSDTSQKNEVLSSRHNEVMKIFHRK